MQVNAIGKQNFGASVNKTAYDIMHNAISSGYPSKKAKVLMRQLENMADDIMISFRRPEEGSVTGSVTLQVANKPRFLRSDYSGVSMNVSPVIMNRRNVFTKYVEAAKLLAQADFRHNNGVYTIA